MRNAFATTFYELSKQDPRLYLVAADISPAAAVAVFQKEYPHRFINVGVAEQIMIGTSAGLAMRGCVPFAYTIATFTIYRPFEQVRVDCCYQNLPVKLVGVGAGVNYSFLGSTHHAQEDVALMSALPNMSILAPCDPSEVVETTRYALAIPGPVYLRLGKAGEPDLTSKAPDPFRPGKIRFIKAGSQICFLSYGPITKMAMDAALKAEKETGKSCAVVSVHCLKPLDREGIAAVLKKFETVVVVEEHSPYGGLGPQVKQIAWDERASCRLHTFSLKDEFIHVYGSHADVLRAHGLDVDSILKPLL